MLQYDLTKKHGGLVLWGDFPTLNRLQDLVGRVMDRKPFNVEVESLMMDLYAELRKTYEGRRKTNESHFMLHDVHKIYGAEFPWPTILIQVALMRDAMGYMDTTKLEQAIMFEFEGIVENALRKAFPETANEILRHAKISVSGSQMTSYSEHVRSRMLYFMALPTRDRAKKLHRVMETLNSMYETNFEMGLLHGGGIAPEAFEGLEFPDRFDY